MSVVTQDQEDEGFVYWLQGQEDERQAILRYLRDVLKNVRQIDSPIGSAQATVKTIIEELEESVHREKK